MWEALVKGGFFGLTLSVMVGPVFFALLDTAIQYGFKASVTYILGVSLSDAFLIFLTQRLTNEISHNAEVNHYFSFISSLGLVFIGMYYVFKKSKSLKFADSEKSLVPHTHFLKGLMLNMLTPSVLIFWTFTNGVIGSTYNNNSRLILVFFVSCLVVVFFADLLKAYTAMWLKKFIKDTYYSILNRIVGLVFIGIGVYNILGVIGSKF